MKVQNIRPLKILIVPDKFKGTLTAYEAARAIARGWSQARPDDELELLPASDGGDGFGEVMGKLLHANVQHCKTLDAAHRRQMARWWWIPKSKVAVIESAQVVGLGMLPPGKFHPFALDTFGLGPVIRAATAKGVQRCIIGIGGSATNDGGFGVARALGWRFLDFKGNMIEQWTGLCALNDIRAPRRRRWFHKLTVAVDVNNPLLGIHGATRVYGPQKGLRPENFQLAEHCLRRLARIYHRNFGKSYARTSGSGAAGGLGFGLLSFLDAHVVPGFDLFSLEAKLQNRLRSAEVVITGEGRLDESTLMGKGVGEIANRCRKMNIPCLALAGMVIKSPEVHKLFKQTRALKDLTTLTRAKSQPAYWLQKLAHNAAATLSNEEPLAHDHKRRAVNAAIKF